MSCNINPEYYFNIFAYFSHLMLEAKQRSRKSETALDLIYKVKADFIIILSFIQSCIKLLLKLIVIKYHFEPKVLIQFFLTINVK